MGRVTLPSRGQLDSGLIDGQQWPRDSSTTWQFDEWFIFSQGQTQDKFVCKMGRVVSLLDSSEMGTVHICV